MRKAPCDIALQQRLHSMLVMPQLTAERLSGAMRQLGAQETAKSALPICSSQNLIRNFKGQ